MFIHVHPVSHFINTHSSSHHHVQTTAPSLPMMPPNAKPTSSHPNAYTDNIPKCITADDLVPKFSGYSQSVQCANVVRAVTDEINVFPTREFYFMTLLFSQLFNYALLNDNFASP